MNNITKNAHLSLRRALTMVAWGYVFLYWDIRLSLLNVLPNWAGFLLLFFALASISREIPTAALLRPFALLLGGWDILSSLLSYFGYSTSVLPVILSVVTLYFHFQLLTDLAALASRYGCPQTSHLLRLRTVNTLLTTLLSLPLPWPSVEWVSIVLLLLASVVLIWICIELFSLRRSLKQTPDEPSPAPTA